MGIFALVTYLSLQFYLFCFSVSGSLSLSLCILSIYLFLSLSAAWLQSIIIFHYPTPFFTDCLQTPSLPHIPTLPLLLKQQIFSYRAVFFLLVSCARYLVLCMLISLGLNILSFALCTKHHKSLLNIVFWPVACVASVPWNLKKNAHILSQLRGQSFIFNLEQQ